jgi:hypothetical protein
MSLKSRFIFQNGDIKYNVSIVIHKVFKPTKVLTRNTGILSLNTSLTTNTVVKILLLCFYLQHYDGCCH